MSLSVYVCIALFDPLQLQLESRKTTARATLLGATERVRQGQKYGRVVDVFGGKGPFIM